MGLAGTADRPMTAAPSAAQQAAFERRDPSRPLALLVRYDGDAQPPAQPIWAAREQQVLVGAVGKFSHAALFEFPNRQAAADFIDAIVGRPLRQGSGQASGRLQVEVLTAFPRRVAIASKLLAWLLPKLPFDNSVDDSEEPGVGASSVMPTREAIAELRAHPSPEAPVTMVNWLKFRPDGGRAAYYRYGKVAILTTHSIGAKLIYAGRYLQTLIGNGGDPGTGRWDEFALMQYAGRANFAYMTSLKRYRRALHHREEGLAEHGQGLVVTEPLPEFTWRR